MSDVEVYQAAWRLAQRIVRTEFVPAQFRSQPESVLAAVLYGRELGMGPMQALQSINVIQGKPTLAPEAMRGRVMQAGHTIQTTDYSAERVTLVGKRADTGVEESVSWTMDDAKRAGLVKSGGAWDKYPRAMLLARATSELCRLLFPDVIAGVSYVPEEAGGELDDVIDVEVVGEVTAEHDGGEGDAAPVTDRSDLASTAVEELFADAAPLPTNVRYATWTRVQLVSACLARGIEHPSDASKLTLTALLTDDDVMAEQATEERRAEDAKAIDERRAG